MQGMNQLLIFVEETGTGVDTWDEAIDLCTVGKLGVDMRDEAIDFFLDGWERGLDA